MASKINIHIGLPKCCSSLIQYNLSILEKKNKISYIGFRPGNRQKWYKSKLESKLLNLELRFSNNYFFNKNLDRYKNFFENQLRRTNKDIWLSSENLSIKLIKSELEFNTKLARINKIFKGFDINYILIFKQFDQMISGIYNEFLYQGLNAKKENFLKLLNLDYESNFLLDLCIKKKIYEIKKSLRNRDNLYVYKFNEDAKELFNQIRKDFDVFNHSKIFKNYSTAEKLKKFDLSKKINLLNEDFGLQEIHRTFWHLSDSIKNKRLAILTKRKNKKKVFYHEKITGLDIKKILKSKNKLMEIDNSFKLPATFKSLFKNYWK